MNLVSISYQRRVWVLAFVMAFAVVASPGAQRPQGGAPSALTIDFVATTADGKPVAELAPTDVAIRVGGKIRSVTSLVLKKPEAGGAPAAEAEADSATPPFATNDAAAATAASAPGRSFIIIVDTDSMGPGTEAAVRTAIEGLLKQLSSTDRVAFSIAPRDTAAVGFGAGIARVRAAVAAMKAQRAANPSNAENLCRTRDTLTMLHSMIEQLAGSETPTSVVFIAAHLSVPGQASSATAGTCEVTGDQYRAIVAAAAAGRTNMYVVQADAGALGRNDGLDNLAGETGAGAVLRVVNEGFAPKVLAESGAYWLATLAPDPSDRPGQTQKLEVKTTREGVTVRARPEAVIPKPGAGSAGAAAAATAKPGTTSARDMIRTAAKFTDLQLRATAYAARGAADKMTVMVMAEPVDPTVKIKEMSVGFFDQEGKGGSTSPAQIATYPITTVLPLGAGQYRLRVAAVDTNGKSGAVDVSINTTLTTAGPLKLSGLLFVAPNEKGVMSPRLIYTNEDKATVVLEMYGTPTAAVEAKFELAKTDIGPALKTLTPTGGGPTNEPDRFQIVSEIPLKDLEPGDYVVRVIVQMAGQPEGRVSKTFRKMAK